MGKVAQSLPYKCLCVDYMLFARLIPVIDELSMLTFFFLNIIL